GLTEGHTISGSLEDSDVAIVLTCTVKTPTEVKICKRLRELNGLGKPLIVAGCMPKVEAELVREVAPKASMVGPNNFLNIIEVLNDTLRGKRIEAIDGGPIDKVFQNRVRKNPTIHIAPISTGCLGYCSYCIVKYARGRLHSFPIQGIVADAKRAIREGCKEIWVTAEDTASYDWNGYKLPDVLRNLCKIEGKFYIRVGMMTPNHAKQILEDLIKVYESEKIFKFLHLPVQSGNDEILEKMRRNYTVDDFREIVYEFRRKIPGLSLSTDIICGFPGETEDQFRDSLHLIDEVKPDVLNISRFWPRPGTEAEKMEGQIHGRETKRRSREMSKLWRRISKEKGFKWIGWEGEALIDEVGEVGEAIGRNCSYKTIVLKENLPLGVFVKVKVTGSGIGYLKAVRV
ncbi:tRNA (N(6)-L-threonylcarbamoyladenosine(37)-C(2))-methylthiotransferase, partial [Candidatus Bathyarchaeota archaeon]|nr:tRNA (N(6)-L-threonylcarbamoyladenosine(37)-C(2))-methylthiotransferase [Candidatus Bathyarchaeota archaeon]